MPRIASVNKNLFQIGWVHYLLHGNTTDVDFEDDNGLLGEPDSADKNLLKGTGVLSIIIIYN
jgi:hypothetical protein